MQARCYLRRVEVRSLGYRTDLAILALEGSQVTDRGDHLVIRTPGNPDARYQSVETHPTARRRGLAGTLVWHAGATALTGGSRTLVMVADPGDAAIRVYRSVGFTVTEPQLSFVRRGI